MGDVVAEMTMSLDGFIADRSDGVEHLFGWYDNGDVAVPTADPGMTWHTSEASAAHLRELLGGVGALVTGRRLFDVANGWRGNHPVGGVPVFVVTHKPPEDWPYPDAPFTFVTDGVASAVEQAQAAAGDAAVGVGAADVVQQCLNLGLVDELRVNLVPVLLGEGIPFFAHLANTPVKLDNPTVIEGESVTHLYYRVTT
jgi:dihydrofolate reductase